MNANTMLALGIMWKGMLGIFVVMGILALVVYLPRRWETVSLPSRPPSR